MSTLLLIGGLVAVVGLVLLWRGAKPGLEEPDRSAPYGEALQAIIRLQRAAHAAENAVRVEMARATVMQLTKPPEE